MPKKIDRSIFLNAVKKVYGNIGTITRQQVLDICDKENLDRPNWLLNEMRFRTKDRGVYSLTTVDVPFKKSKNDTNKVAKVNQVEKPAEAEVNQVNMALAAINMNAKSPINLVPEKANGYVPFGHFSDVRTIVKSQKFYPMYITGLSGNGKTMMIEQICASEKREMVRVNTKTGEYVERVKE